MNIVARIAGRLAEIRQSRALAKSGWHVFKAPGAYHDLHTLSTVLQKAIDVLEEDHAELKKALADAEGYTKVLYKSRFHNDRVPFHGPGEVRGALASNAQAIRIFKLALNISQTEPHPDIEQLLGMAAEGSALAA